MMDNILFDKYTKTVLWNYKNKKGNYLKKRYALNSSSVEFDASYAPADTKVIGSYNGYIEALLNKCEKVPKDLLDRVCKNPNTIEDCMDLLDDCFGEGQYRDMNDKNKEWWDSSDDDDWDWVNPDDYEVNEKRKGGKMKSYYIQFKDSTTHSALIDATNESDAIAQVLEDYLEDPNTSDVDIISIIEVDDEDE